MWSLEILSQPQIEAIASFPLSHVTSEGKNQGGDSHICEIL